MQVLVGSGFMDSCEREISRLQPSPPLATNPHPSFLRRQESTPHNPRLQTSHPFPVRSQTDQGFINSIPQSVKSAAFLVAIGAP